MVVHQVQETIFQAPGEEEHGRDEDRNYGALGWQLRWGVVVLDVDLGEEGGEAGGRHCGRDGGGDDGGNVEGGNDVVDFSDVELERERSVLGGDEHKKGKEFEELTTTMVVTV